MSDGEITLALQPRSEIGKKVKHLRKQGFLPAVIHDHGKESVLAMAPTTEVNRVFKAAGKHHTVTLTLGKETYLTMIKDIDVEPKKYQLRHIVFGAIKSNETVDAEIPLVLTGEVPAEKVGLMMIKGIDHVEVKALPKYLPDEILVDVSGLAADGDKITVADLIVPEGVTVQTEPEHIVAHIEEPRSLAADLAAEEAEQAEAGVTEATVPSDTGTTEE